MWLPLYSQSSEAGILTDDEAWSKKKKKREEDRTASGAVRSAEAIMDIFVKTDLKVSHEHQCPCQLLNFHGLYMNPLTWNLSSSFFFSRKCVTLVVRFHSSISCQMFSFQDIGIFSFDWYNGMK